MNPFNQIMRKCLVEDAKCDAGLEEINHKIPNSHLNQDKKDSFLKGFA
jgi:hypothetical protein